MVSDPVRKSSNLGRVELVGAKKQPLKKLLVEILRRKRVVQSPLCQGAVPCFAKKLGMDGIAISRFTGGFQGGFLQFLPR